MRNILLLFNITISLVSIPALNFGHAPTLGSCADFVFFSTNGSVSNTGISLITGNVGTNNGSSTAFGNVNGVVHDQDGTSAKAAADLQAAYNQINSTMPKFFLSSLLGNGSTFVAGDYSIAGTAKLNFDLTLDAEGNSNAVFIFQIQGAFSTNATSSIKLINGAFACNVFWKVEGLVDISPGTIMRGTVIANNAAIKIRTGSTLEGRALSIAGAVTIDVVLANTPIGCASTLLNGPVGPDLGSTHCYALFSSNGQVTNTGITTVTGDVGTNVGITTGFDQLQVSGTIHPIPDVSTSKCASDLDKVYQYLNNLPYDIKLLNPDQLGAI